MQNRLNVGSWILLNWPLGRFSLVVAMSVCVCECVSHPGNDASQWSRDLWSKGVSLILAYLHFKKKSFSYNNFFAFVLKLFRVFGASLLCTSLLWTSLLWIMGEGLWLWLLAIVTGDRLQVTRNTWHMTCDSWHMTHDSSSFFFSFLFFHIFFLF